MNLLSIVNELNRSQEQMFTNLAALKSGGSMFVPTSDLSLFNELLQLEPGENSIRNLVVEVNLKKVTVEDIHHDFYGAGETLLAEAKQILQNASDKEFNSKVTRLKALGFTKAAEVRAHENAKALREESIKIMNRLCELKQDYPLTRFISHSDVNQLCDKYNLVLGPASAYTGTIPEDNLREIEKSLPLKQKDINPNYSKLCIVAPPSDMDTNRSRRELFFIPDPIVLEPVKGGFYRILTAWGPEAKDPAVIPSYEN